MNESDTSGGGDGVSERVDPSASDGVPEGTIFDVLSNRRRRYALHYLMQRPNEPVEMSDLSARVAAWELDAPPDQLSYDDRKRVHTALYQYHAPKLDDAGLAEYDSRRGVIELTPAAAGLSLDVARGSDRPWPRYLLTAAGTVTLATAGAGVGLPTPVGVPLTAAVAAAFLLSVAAFAYDRYTVPQLGDDGPPPTHGSRSRR